ncbi:MAG: type II toxin-antitoxin system HicB family antitoxin [Anaerolineae bacterium]
MTLKVILEKGANGYIIAECPQIPGCMSQGKTKEEALANIKDAVQACLKVMMEDMIAASTVPTAARAPEGAEERGLELVSAESLLKSLVIGIGQEAEKIGICEEEDLDAIVKILRRRSFEERYGGTEAV